MRARSSSGMATTASSSEASVLLLSFSSRASGSSKWVRACERARTSCAQPDRRRSVE